MFLYRDSKEPLMKSMLRKKKQADAKRIVNKRIEYLFLKAEEVAKKDLGLANRYVLLARNLSMRLNVPISGSLRKRFCKHCYTYLVPGLNYRVRTKNAKVVYTCNTCQKYMRFPFVREIKERRKCRQN
jgi:ribonuclease P protein subunit RPR2